MKLQEFLGNVHGRLRPRTYMEIGIAKGASLAESRCRTIAIDPGFQIDTELACDVQLHRVTSDDFFAKPNPVEWFKGTPTDLAFIDGMHLFEFALRDFINMEKHSHQGGVIVFDDILPRNPSEAARNRHTGFWTGDVFKIIPTLHEYRPELIVLPVDTWPTGTLVVMGLDPNNTVLSDRYDEILAKYRTDDPQDVPKSLMARECTLKPQKVLDGTFWSVLRRQRMLPGRLRTKRLLGNVMRSVPLRNKVRPAFQAMVDHVNNPAPQAEAVAADK